MRLIIAGSRSFTDFQLLSEKMDIFCANHLPDVVLCGKAAGADTLGELWAINRGIPVASHPADWKRHGKGAGPIRNEEMAKNATHLVLFWDGKSPGSRDMLRRAKSHQLKVRVVNCDVPDQV